MSNELLPDIFGGTAAPLAIPSSGIYAPRLLVSHGKDEGALAPAWAKYGSLEQGELVVQENDNFYRCDPRDAWFLLPSLSFIFAGVRDAWTKQLLSASFDLTHCERGGQMQKQVMSAGVWVPDKTLTERKDEDDLPDVIVCMVSMEKARCNGPLALLKQLERYAKLESKTPLAFRAYAHFFGRVQRSKPNEQGKTFPYSAIEARIKTTPEDLVSKVAKLLVGQEDRFALIADQIENERRVVEKLSS